MDCENSNITILVVDHDEESLTFVANILMEQQYKVQTAKNAHDALVTLRNNEGLIDIIITEFHVLGMNGFDFQKHIQDQFLIPVIMMSKDNRQHIISKTLENGATHFIVKPVCAEDFKDIWEYVIEAKEHKVFIENLFTISEEKSSEQPNTKKEDGKKKSIDVSRGKQKYQLVRKASRLVWTHELHEIFIDAVNKIGLEKAVPMKILELMDIPDLTRDNVASHLQKYRSFLENAAEKEMMGDMSYRTLKSTFAWNLPTSVIKEIHDIRTNKLLEQTFYQIGAEFSYRQGLMATSSSSSPNFLTGNFKFGETSYHNDGSIGSDYFNHINHGVKNWDLEALNNSSTLAKNVTCDARNNNPFGIQINNRSEMGGIGTMNQRWFESIGIRDDNVNSNNFGLNVGGQNANVNFGSLGYENFGLVQEGFGSFSYVGSGSGSGSEFQEELFKEGNVYENREIPLQKLNGNILEYEQNYNGGISTNVAEFNQMGFNNSNFSLAYDMDLLNKMNENNDASAFLQSDLINSIQDVQPLDQLYNGGGDTSLIGNTSCVLNEYSPISVNQNSMQLYLGGDLISSPAEINSFMLNESPMSLDQNSNLLQGNEQFSNGDLYDMFMVDKMSEASTSATTNPKMDMDLFEAVFGTVDN